MQDLTFLILSIFKLKIAIFISKFYPEFSGVSIRIIKLYKEFYKKKKIYVDVYTGGENTKFSKNYNYKFFKVRKLNDTLKIKVKLIKIFYEIISFIHIFKILKKKNIILYMLSAQII